MAQQSQGVALAGRTMATGTGGEYAADAIFLATIALFLGALTETVQEYLPVPYTVQLVCTLFKRFAQFS